MTTRRALLVLGATVSAGALARPASAYPTGSQFDLDPVVYDGAGGAVFTGAPRWSGHTCSVCHVDPLGRIGAELQAAPATLFTGGYQPAQRYRLRVVLVGEWAGLAARAAGDACGDPAAYKPCDDNGFALEIVDAAGKPQGDLAPLDAGGGCGGGAAGPDPEVYVLRDGTAAVHAGAHHARTQWDLCWKAPARGTGPLTAYVAVVDGNGGDGSAKNPNDATGDDVFAGAVPLVEVGGQGPPAQQGTGCGVAPGRGAESLLLVLLALVGAWRRRRRLAPLALAALLAGGCATVKPWEREKLAKKKMQLDADPEEAELDNHMQDAREGSSGGYGSAGGGCGCN